jgi:hypothetical protein
VGKGVRTEASAGASKKLVGSPLRKGVMKEGAGGPPIDCGKRIHGFYCRNDNKEEKP